MSKRLKIKMIERDVQCEFCGDICADIISDRGILICKKCAKSMKKPKDRK